MYLLNTLAVITKVAGPKQRLVIWGAFEINEPSCSKAGEGFYKRFKEGASLERVRQMGVYRNGDNGR